MKLLLLGFFLTTKIFAQNANITTETNTNNQLLQNSAQSQIYQQQAAAQSGAAVPRPSINPDVQAPGVNGNGLNLTDQDKQLSENYVNQAGANKIIQQNCSGDMEAVCAGREGKNSFLGIDSNIMKLASKAYATIGALGDGKLAMNDKDGKPVKEETDYCKYIPTVTETLATFSQQQAVNNMNSTPQSADTAQKDTLLKAAISHDERAKMAQIQAVGWFGGAACYTYMATSGGAVRDTKMYVKIGAGVFLGSFYQSEVSTNQGNADKLRAIAASLPGKGDCNPITQKTCYCAQKENQGDAQYTQYCMAPGLSTQTIPATSYRVACTDNTMKIDPACNCTKTNTCFDQLLGTQVMGNALGIGTMSGTALSPVRALARGELVGGNISGNNPGAAALAIAQRGLATLASKIVPNNNPMNSDQNAYAKAIVSQGIPSSVAQLMAQQNISKAALDSAAAKFQGTSGGINIPTMARRSNELNFSGGSGLGITGKTTTSKNNDFLSQFKTGSKAAGGANPNLLVFAARAQAQAQAQSQIISSDKPLFEIISNRYQESARRLLELDPPAN